MDPKHRSPSFLPLPTRNHGNAYGNFKSNVNANSLLFFLCFFASMSTPTAQSQTPTPPPPTNPFGQAGHKFNSSMAIVMVVLVMAFFFMGFFSVYIRQCTERRSRGENWEWDSAVNFGRRSRRLMRGLDPSVIESFPTFLYSTVKGFKIGKDTLECAVCLNEFEDHETLRMIPICSHVFHPDCIDAWLSSHSTCPVCRANLASNPVDTITCAANAEVNQSESEPEINNHAHAHETSHIDDVNQTRDIEAPDENLVNSKRSRSTGWRLTRLFPRSHSTGHSLVQPGENCERFTLRLPEDVRSRLMSSGLNRTKSCVALPRARSSRRGYRSRSLGRNYYSCDRSDQTMTPPFFSRMGSAGLATPSNSLSKSIKSPFDRLLIGGSGEEKVGERSSNRLLSETQV